MKVTGIDLRLNLGLGWVVIASHETTARGVGSPVLDIYPAEKVKAFLVRVRVCEDTR